MVGSRWRRARDDASPSATHGRDGEQLLGEIVPGAREDGDLRALHHPISDGIEWLVDDHVVGDPLALAAIEFDGNPRRALMARRRPHDSSEHRIGFADVEIRTGASAARDLVARPSWLGIVPGIRGVWMLELKKVLEELVGIPGARGLVGARVSAGTSC